MSTNQQSIYLDGIKQLVKTITIKSADTVLAMNQYVVDYFGESAINRADPSSWRYYRHVAGEYHPIDREMTITSRDTLETIIFSKTNLAIHLATARAYVYGTREYKELVAAYPDQEDLILGILYPVDKAKAIAAKDGQILGYPAYLVEANEYSLISKLQDWVYGYKTRWTNVQYAISDEYYTAYNLAIMYAMMVPQIANLRLQATNTLEAHSFHVRMYLTSHGFKDFYLDVLTLKQSLFFYRNINYIRRNAGKRVTFAWLVEHIMTERALPIAEFVMRHDVSQMPESLAPEVVFRRNPLNLGYSPIASDVIDLDTMLLKEDPLARDNNKFKDQLEPKIREAMENSTSNVMATKVLESAVVDYANSNPITLNDVLINQWLWLASKNLYNAFIQVTDPNTGDTYSLSAREAWTFFWYAYFKTIGITLDNIPLMPASHVQRIPLVTADEIWGIVDHSVISRNTAVKALSKNPAITAPIISTETFYQLCSKIYDATVLQRLMVANEQHQAGRGMLQNMILRIYGDAQVRLYPAATSYATWFSSRNIKIANLSASDLAVLYMDIAQKATGLDLHKTTTLAELQSAMTRLLGDLSSYSIQIVTEINDSNMKRTDWGVIRVGANSSQMQDHQQNPDASVEVVKAREMMRDRQLIPVKFQDNRAVHQGMSDKQKGPSTAIRVLHESGGNIQQHVEEFIVEPRLVVDLPTNTEGNSPVPGIDIFLGLDSNQRASLRDIYNQYTTVPPPPGPNIVDELPDTDLDGLDYPPQ